MVVAADLPNDAFADRIGVPFEKLSVFYPMWNEEAYIERALERGPTRL